MVTLMSEEKGGACDGEGWERGCYGVGSFEHTLVEQQEARQERKTRGRGGGKRRGLLLLSSPHELRSTVWEGRPGYVSCLVHKVILGRERVGALRAGVTTLVWWWSGAAAVYTSCTLWGGMRRPAVTGSTV